MRPVEISTASRHVDAVEPGAAEQLVERVVAADILADELQLARERKAARVHAARVAIERGRARHLADERVQVIGGHRDVARDVLEPARVADAGEGDALATAAREVARPVDQVLGHRLGAGDPHEAALGVDVDRGERVAVAEKSLGDEEPDGELLEVVRRGLGRGDFDVVEVDGDGPLARHAARAAGRDLDDLHADGLGVVVARQRVIRRLGGVACVGEVGGRVHVDERAQLGVDCAE